MLLSGHCLTPLCLQVSSPELESSEGLKSLCNDILGTVPTLPSAHPHGPTLGRPVPRLCFHGHLRSGGQNWAYAWWARRFQVETRTPSLDAVLSLVSYASQEGPPPKLLLGTTVTPGIGPQVFPII